MAPLDTLCVLSLLRNAVALEEERTSSLLAERAICAIEESGIAFQGTQVLQQGSRLPVEAAMQPGQNVLQSERQGNDTGVVHSLTTCTTTTMLNTRQGCKELPKQTVLAKESCLQHQILGVMQLLELWSAINTIQISRNTCDDGRFAL